ncbi:MAG: transcription antitermination factor NusB [Acidimicrobiales bacterium]
MALATRRQARERALCLLYEAQAKDRSLAEVLGELPVVPDDFVVDVVTGVERREPEIDALIAAHSIAWSVGRMPVVDRTLLRMATFELLALQEVPTGVVISEAVELARLYSTEDSSRFVNGVLAAIAGQLRPGSPAAP